MRISYFSCGGWMTALAEGLQKQGHDITSDCDENVDVIISMSVGQLPKLKAAHTKYPKIPFFNYNWDVYSWVWTRPREGEYDYTEYGKFLKDSVEVWCPSLCTVEQMEQWYGVSGIVIPTYSVFYDTDTKDGNYVYNPLRKLPDECVGWTKRACEELNIPYKGADNHEHEWEDYKKLIANCTLIVSDYKEASTGSLALLEALYLQKPILISDSPLNGADDYVGKYARHFNHADYENLKEELQKIWVDRPKQKNMRVELRKEFSPQKMASKINDRLLSLL